MFCLTETKTNEKTGNINEALIKQKEHLFESLKYPWIKHDVCKLRALIGLIYYHGLYGMNDHSFNILFSDKAKLSIFSFTMSRESMKFLLSTLTFDNPEERKEKFLYDLFAAARSINERFNSNTSKYLLPFLYLSINQNFLPQIVF